MKKRLLCGMVLGVLLLFPALGCWGASTSVLVALETPKAAMGSFSPASEEASFSAQAVSILSQAKVPLTEIIPLPYLGMAVVRTSATPEAALKALTETPGVEQASLPGKNKAFGSAPAYVPTEPLYSQQWYLPALNCPTAWDTTKGDSSFVVAVVDTGVDYDHQDLAASMWTNSQEIPNNGIDDDGNGIVDDYYGMAAYNQGGTVTGNPDDILPDGGHGTHVAGSIAAPINNIGILGVAPQVKIMGLRCFTYIASAGQSTAWDSDIATCLNYILAMKTRGENIRAANFSLGGDPGETPSPVMEQAYNTVADAGILIFLAAGNESNDNDAYAVYPANYNISTGIAVGATDTDGTTQADFSNYGATTVDIFAPGTSILSTVPTTVNVDGYDSWNGTSMATPVCLGAGMLAWSANPGLSALEVRSLLLENGTAVPGLAWSCVTGMVVDAAKAVAAAAAEPTTAPTATPIPTATTVPTQTPTNTPVPGSGSSGGGCSFGMMPLLGLVFLLPLTLLTGKKD